MIDDIDTELEIAAPIERVWSLMTGEAFVPQWLGCMNYRAEIGHVFHMQQDPAKRAAGDISGATHCELLSLTPPEKMVFSWFYPGTPATEVALTLAPSGTGTTVRLVHTGWDQFDPDQIATIRDALAGGWSSFVLPNLQRLALAA